jgi:hypothetical protein
MTSWSPTIEGFRSLLRMPAVPLAEVAWRWSFGAAASVLIGLGVFEYLDTLPVSPGDLLMLRTGHPILMANALSHISRGSGLRLSMALALLFSTLAILWILLASIGRAATLGALVSYIRERSCIVRKQLEGSSRKNPTTIHAAAESSASRFPSLAGLHFLRVALALAACAGCLGALILAGFASSKTSPHPALTFFLALILSVLVWMAWSSISWLLSLASIFVVRQGQDAFGALASSVDLCRDRFGSVAAVGTWVGLGHLVLFILATSAGTFPFAFAPVLPLPVVLAAVLLLTLVYFAIVDTLYIARMAGYVAILEAPPISVASISADAAAVSTQQSAPSVQSASAVDQEELILGDNADSPQDALSLLPTELAPVDQNELILSDQAGNVPRGDSAGQDPEAAS